MPVDVPGDTMHMVCCWYPSRDSLASRGRKKAALTYVATYAFGCFTKHFNNFKVLLVGRIFCGVSTSLLFSAFESWLVAEHFKVSRLSAAGALLEPAVRPHQALAPAAAHVRSGLYNICSGAEQFLHKSPESIQRPHLM